MAPTTTAHRVSTFVLDSNQPSPTPSQPPSPAISPLFLTSTEDHLGDVSPPKMGSLAPAFPVRKGDDSQSVESSQSSFPSLAPSLVFEHQYLDESLVNDPPCSNSLLCAFETLTSGGLRSGRSRGLTTGSQRAQKGGALQPSMLHEAVAATKRHYVTNRVECKDSDGARMSFPSQLSITAHDQGTHNTHVYIASTLLIVSCRSGNVHSEQSERPVSKQGQRGQAVVHAQAPDSVQATLQASQREA